jgi:hypothetical protein
LSKLAFPVAGPGTQLTWRKRQRSWGIAWAGEWGGELFFGINEERDPARVSGHRSRDCYIEDLFCPSSSVKEAKRYFNKIFEKLVKLPLVREVTPWRLLGGGPFLYLEEPLSSRKGMVWSVRRLWEGGTYRRYVPQNKLMPFTEAAVELLVGRSKRDE